MKAVYWLIAGHLFSFINQSRIFLTFRWKISLISSPTVNFQ